MSQPPSLSSDERRQLRVFVRVVHQMVRRPFIQSIKHVEASGRQRDDGEWEATFPDFNVEHFRSFMLDFRKVAISNDDDAYLFRIKNILARILPHERAELGAMHETLKQYLNPKPTSEPNNHTQLAVLKAIVNGDLFHDAQEYEALAERLRSAQHGLLIFFLSSLIQTVLLACNFMVRTILRAGLLTSEELPEALRSTGSPPVPPAASPRQDS